MPWIGTRVGLEECRFSPERMCVFVCCWRFLDSFSARELGLNMFQQRNHSILYIYIILYIHMSNMRVPSSKTKTMRKHCNYILFFM